MSNSSYGQTLRSPTSSLSEASASSSPRSLLEGSNRTSLDNTVRSVGSYGSSLDERKEFIGGEWLSKQNNGVEVEEPGRRRRRPRNSGGFLLDSLPPTSRTEPANINGVGKGKDRDDGTNGHITIGRKRQHAAHRPKPSIGSSPLATKVTNAASQHDQESRSIFSRPSTIYGKSDDAANVASTNKPYITGITQISQKNKDSIDPSSFDSDPTQIVNLALSLSESRRRQFSMGRLSPLNPVTNRRVASSNQLVNSRHSTAILERSIGENPNQRMTQQRHSSKDVFSKVERHEPLQSTSPHSRLSQEQAQEYELLDSSSLGLDLRHDMSFAPSDATLLRVERAKLSLELGYEYRRLLQYLPVLPISSRNKSETFKAAGKRSNETPEVLSRPYNPLQFIRNRKVRRGHERKLYSAEAEGWKDLSKVRDWVGTVAGEREDQVSKVDDKFPLPPFRIEQEETTTEAPSPSSSIQHSREVTATKIARPRSDWHITPWDLLADAYWLNQDDNKRLIEDRDGNKLFHSKKLTDEPIPGSNHDTARVTSRRSESMTRLGQSPTKTNSTVVDVHDEDFKERGRRRHRFRDSVSSLQEYGSSQDRNRRWQRRLIRSRSSSSSDSSVPGSLNRLRQNHGRQDSRERRDSALLEKQIMDLLAKEAENNDWRLSHGNNISGLGSSMIRHPMQDLHSNSVTQEQETPRPILVKSDVQNNEPQKPQKDQRASLERRYEQQGCKPQLSFEELDTTAPNSPSMGRFVSSIAINLSPPISRSPSPKKVSALTRSRTKDRRSKGRDAIDGTDFAIEPESPTDRTRNILTQSSSKSIDGEPLTGSSDGLLSPKLATENIGRILKHRRSDSKFIKISKDSKEPDSRIRGLVKGGRLAEIIGNEVSRVGDFLWRKDGSNHSSTIASPVSSQASDVSDSEEDLLATRPRRDLEDRVTHTNTNKQNSKKFFLQKANNEDPPKYHMSNLPSFKSPFREEESGLLNDSEYSPITRQQDLREGRRSNRFDRLAPPNLDMRGVSRSASPSHLSRVVTRDTDATYDGSRRNSVNPSETSAGRADRQFNAIRGPLDRIGHGGPPVTGLASLDSRRHHSSERPKLEGNRQWSISDQGVSAVRDKVTKQDIIRTRALLLSSGMKANEIVRRANEIRDPPSLILQDLRRMMKTPLPRVPKSQEHVLAAHLLDKNITEANNRIRDVSDKFSNVTTKQIHERIKAVDERTTSQLTPSLRASGDDADTLGTEMITSYRLEVKRLNDSIDLILRRRRRRLRWVRRGGYLVLEWILLGAMWWVWLIVVIVRLVRGTVGGVYRGTRWLFWL